jgi:hypothetical protein
MLSNLEGATDQKYMLGVVNDLDEDLKRKELRMKFGVESRSVGRIQATTGRLAPIKSEDDQLMGLDNLYLYNIQAKLKLLENQITGTTSTKKNQLEPLGFRGKSLTQGIRTKYSTEDVGSSKFIINPYGRLQLATALKTPSKLSKTLTLPGSDQKNIKNYTNEESTYQKQSHGEKTDDMLDGYVDRA